MHERVAIDFAIDDEAKIYDVKFAKGSGNAQLDADCLEAVLGASAYQPRTDLKGEKLQLGIIFDNQSRLGYVNPASRKPKDTSSKTATVNFHLIPLTVLERYPGLFNATELLADENIGVISAEPSMITGTGTALNKEIVEELISIYNDKWVTFFSRHRKATRKQLLAIREELRRKY